MVEKLNAELGVLPLLPGRVAEWDARVEHKQGQCGEDTGERWMQDVDPVVAGLEIAVSGSKLEVLVPGLALQAHGEHLRAGQTKQESAHARPERARHSSHVCLASPLMNVAFGSGNNALASNDERSLNFTLIDGNIVNQILRQQVSAKRLCGALELSTARPIFPNSIIAISSFRFSMTGIWRILLC